MLHQAEFTEQALTRLSEIYLIQSMVEAIPVLKRLENEARFPQNVVFAQSNLMKANYQVKIMLMQCLCGKSIS